MPNTYRATWKDVPQLQVEQLDLMTALAETEVQYESFVGDPADDPDYVSPTFTWRLRWDSIPGRRLQLIADDKPTDVYVDTIRI